MSNIRTLASWLATAALIVLAPVIGFAVVVTAEMLTDAVGRFGTPVVWLVGVVALGWVLLRQHAGQTPTSRLRSKET